MGNIKCTHGCKCNKCRSKTINKLNYVSRQIKLGGGGGTINIPYVEWKDIQGNQKVINISGFNNDVFIEDEIPNWKQLLINKLTF